MTLTFASVLVGAYLLGSLSSAVMIAKLKQLPDPRSLGSKNPGATNMLRISGKKAASAVLIADIVKGMIPVWSSYHLLGLQPLALGFVAMATCLGHIYPIFFNFKGGKGVATALGAIAPLGLGLSLLIITTWIMVALISRFSSLASLSCALLTPLYTWLISPAYTLPVALLCCLIIYRHQANIHRLLAGTEPKIGDTKSV